MERGIPGRDLAHLKYSLRGARSDRHTVAASLAMTSKSGYQAAVIELFRSRSAQRQQLEWIFMPAPIPQRNGASIGRFVTLAPQN